MLAHKSSEASLGVSMALVDEILINLTARRSASEHLQHAAAQVHAASTHPNPFSAQTASSAVTAIDVRTERITTTRATTAAAAMSAMAAMSAVAGVMNGAETVETSSNTQGTSIATESNQRGMKRPCSPAGGKDEEGSESIQQEQQQNWNRNSISYKRMRNHDSRENHEAEASRPALMETSKQSHESYGRQCTHSADDSQTSQAGTSNNNVNEELRSSLTCSVCLDLFYRPCTLRCGHSFCRECLVRYEATQRESLALRGALHDNTKTPCPSCREPTVCSTNLCESITLKQMVERCFPQHVAERESETRVEADRLRESLIRSRERLLRFRQSRAHISQELALLRLAFLKKRKEHDAVLKACTHELHRAQKIKAVLDNNAPVRSVAPSSLP